MAALSANLSPQNREDNEALLKLERLLVRSRITDSAAQPVPKELSVERAKLGRERTDLDERRHEFEAEQARRAKDPAPLPTDRAATKTGGGRWLARLGLRDHGA